MRTGIDLNCDVGEGMGNEHLLFPYISSCNIATGGHAGDARSMFEVASLAAEHQIRIGAHPSYPDRGHFGRISRVMEKKEFQASIEAQVDGLLQVLASLNLSMHHIKAHGALYNDLARGGRMALEYLEVLQPFRKLCILYAPCGSEFARVATERGYAIWEEAFADRAYEPDGSLVSRSQSGAVLTDPAAVAQQVLEMVRRNRVECSDGSFYAMTPGTLCVHGDNPKAIAILEYLTKCLSEASIPVLK
ncbi:5-oxoprolinase subunit PxpA [Robiginitalea sp.]|jgi:UPF0271 protein|uniref:5-oxoprolinase subunit PxpA n=1 Tax=Robiginitalea sp. TaxID=1902411 RepID=UPI003C724067